MTPWKSGILSVVYLSTQWPLVPLLTIALTQPDPTPTLTLIPTLTLASKEMQSMCPRAQRGQDWTHSQNQGKCVCEQRGHIL